MSWKIIENRVAIRVKYLENYWNLWVGWARGGLVYTFFPLLDTSMTCTIVWLEENKQSLSGFISDLHSTNALVLVDHSLARLGPAAT